MASTNSNQVEVLDNLSDADLVQLLEVVDRATATDGINPLSEHTSLQLRFRPDRVLAIRDSTGAIRGFAYLDRTAQPAEAELVVDPAHRRTGVGTALIHKLVEVAPAVDLWAHGARTGTESLARIGGFEPVRTLCQMRRSLEFPLPAPDLPGDITIRTFQPGADESAWLALNARAFADHPEQGRWNAADLAQRMGQPWFDPSGFFIAERGRMIGFHWTKVHSHLHERVGEVYVVGVDPAEQGHGLGAALTIIGLAHLRSLGIRMSMLYVDVSNGPAIAVYERLGFTCHQTDVSYRR